MFTQTTCHSKDKNEGTEVDLHVILGMNKSALDIGSLYKEQVLYCSIQVRESST